MACCQQHSEVHRGRGVNQYIQNVNTNGAGKEGKHLQQLRFSRTMGDNAVIVHPRFVHTLPEQTPLKDPTRLDSLPLHVVHLIASKLENARDLCTFERVCKCSRSGSFPWMIEIVVLFCGFKQGITNSKRCWSGFIFLGTACVVQTLGDSSCNLCIIE